jgi:hypothetical protein
MRAASDSTVRPESTHLAASLPRISPDRERGGTELVPATPSPTDSTLRKEGGYKKRSYECVAIDVDKDMPGNAGKTLRILK